MGRGSLKRPGAPVAARRSIRGPRVFQPEQGADLVEGLAGRVVASLAQQAVVAPGADVDQHGVAAAHQQGDERRFQVGMLQHRGEEVPFEVMDTDQRQAVPPRQRLAVHQPDE
jgi:hypothetical protein